MLSGDSIARVVSLPEPVSRYRSHDRIQNTRMPRTKMAVKWWYQGIRSERCTRWPYPMRRVSVYHDQIPPSKTASKLATGEITAVAAIPNQRSSAGGEPPPDPPNKAVHQKRIQDSESRHHQHVKARAAVRA
jgi:hypothetical protein